MSISPSGDTLRPSSVSTPPVVANRLLSALPAEVRQRVSAQLTVVPLRFKQMLQKQGHAIDAVYFPCAGAVSLMKKLTHEFLAIMLGVRRPTVTLIIGELEKAGLVTNQRGTVSIVDRPRLEQVSCECYATAKANFARLLPEISGPVG